MKAIKNIALIFVVALIVLTAMPVQAQSLISRSEYAWDNQDLAVGPKARWNSNEIYTTKGMEVVEEVEADETTDAAVAAAAQEAAKLPSTGEATTAYAVAGLIVLAAGLVVAKKHI